MADSRQKHIDIFPEEVEYEEELRSIGDETPSDDTGEQDEITAKRKRGKNVASSETVDSENTVYTTKKRKKKSRCWEFLDIIGEGKQKIVKCKLCQHPMKMSKSSCTTTYNRHVDKCKASHGLTKQSQLQFKVSENSSEVTVASFKYDHAEMRKTVSHYILVNELPFMHVESFMFNEVMRKATPHWQKISRATVKNDCHTTYEIEKKRLKEVFKSVKKINITTDMWTSSHQKIGYMVVTGHWIDSNWKLNMRVLNFCNVPPPHNGHVIAEALFKCFDEWGIVDKIGTLTVDNAKANDVALRNLKEMFSIRRTLSLEGKMFHARCCAHILNLCVQDGLKPIESIVDRIRDGIKYVAGSEGRRNKFSEISTQLQLKPKKLILDVPTRWNSTFHMLQCAIQFKLVFPRFATLDNGFMDYVPNMEDWEKVEGVCSLLEVFNDVTKIVSGSEYPTSNLFLSEIRRVKQVIDKKTNDTNHHIREMARSMKSKFDKYWGESNLVMSIGAVMDPRFKMKLPNFCFPSLYPLDGESARKLSFLTNTLNDLYQEYCVEDRANKIERNECSQVSSSDANVVLERETPQGLNDYESFIRESGAILEPMKSELEEYLSETIVIPTSKFFDALNWWKGNSAKYPILSNMARDILSIPISTVASESTFSAGGRVIEPHRSCLKPETVEMLLCGADWTRELYGLKKSKQDTLKEVEIILT